MFNKKLASKIDSLIKKNFSIIYDYKFEGIVLLFGGAARSLIMGESVKDLDFVILTQNNCQILDFLKKYKLEYTMNALGGYKINYNNFIIDMFSTNDLMNAARYNIDMMFYDIHKHFFISCGAISAIENAEIVELNADTKPLYCDIFRLKKLIKFIKFVHPNKKKVKVKENKLVWIYKMFCEFLRNPSKITKLFRR